jgi:DNA-binding MarR family transcriptional regulator
MGEAPGFGDCAGFNTRRAARLVGQVYDRALEPTGLMNTQFSALAILNGRGATPISELARRMGVDRTTLTRNLKLLERRRMIRFTPGTDARVRLVEVTAEGREGFDRAVPAWRAVQKRMIERFGADRWQALKAELGALSEAAAEVGER